MQTESDRYSITKEPSKHRPGQVNILVTGKTEQDCQAGVFEVMDETSRATFTLPVRTASGEWVAIGHAERPSIKSLVELAEALEYAHRAANR